jgi:hypothetical protein
MHVFTSRLLLLMETIDCITTVIGIMYFDAIECNVPMASIISANTQALVVIKLTTTVFAHLIFYTGKQYPQRKTQQNQHTFTAIQELLKMALTNGIASLFIVVPNNLLFLHRHSKPKL